MSLLSLVFESLLACIFILVGAIHPGGTNVGRGTGRTLILLTTWIWFGVTRAFTDLQRIKIRLLWLLAIFAKTCKATFNFMVSEASPRQEDLEELNVYSYQMAQN